MELQTGGLEEDQETGGCSERRCGVRWCEDAEKRRRCRRVIHCDDP